MFDDAAVFLVNTREESRDVDEGDQGDVEGIAEANEPGGFDACVDVKAAGEDSGLVGDDPNGATVHAGKADKNVARVCPMNLKEVAIIDDLSDEVSHIVRLGGVGGDDGLEGIIATVNRVSGGYVRSVFSVVCGEEAEELADRGDA